MVLLDRGETGEYYKGSCGSGGTAVAHWLRCCATNGKVAGSIPASVSDIKLFQSHYGPVVDSASEVITRSISWG